MRGTGLRHGVNKECWVETRCKEVVLVCVCVKQIRERDVREIDRRREGRKCVCLTEKTDRNNDNKRDMDRRNLPFARFPKYLPAVAASYRLTVLFAAKVTAAQLQVPQPRASYLRQSAFYPRSFHAARHRPGPPGSLSHLQHCRPNQMRKVVESEQARVAVPRQRSGSALCARRALGGAEWQRPLHSGAEAGQLHVWPLRMQLQRATCPCPWRRTGNAKRKQAMGEGEEE